MNRLTHTPGFVEVGLTPEQRTAASHVGSHARLLAGPGTGKTLTLTRRIVYLVSERGVSPDRILALTFTRAAVAELSQRVAVELGKEVPKPRVSTLHSFALHQLLRNEARVNLPQPLRVADDWEERWIIVEDLKTLLGISADGTTDLLARLSADWQKLAADRGDWERTFPHPQFQGAWQEHRQVFGYTLRSELVYQLKTALDEGNINVEGPPLELLLDEYQDLNPCDLAVVRALAGLGSRVYVAGDDDQSIYGFRYAHPEGIRRFPTEFAQARELTLEACQRCDDRILQYGLYVARQDTRRIDKPLRPMSAPGTGEIHLLRFQDQGYEAVGIASICKQLSRRKGVRPEAVLILLRSDRNRVFSTPLRAALISEGLPVGIVSNPLEPLDSPQGRIFLAILRLVVNPSDHLAWRTLLVLRDNGLGAKSLGATYDCARGKGWTYARALDEIVKDPSLIGTRGDATSIEVQAIRQVINDSGPAPVKDVLAWLEAVAVHVIPAAETRSEALDVFSRVAAVSGADSLEGLLRALNVSLAGFEQERPTGAVSIMTMHQAKGLTADAVVVAAAEDQYIPGRAAGDAVDDERRLLYVSLTRARHFLYLTYATQRTGPQRHTGRTAGQKTRDLTRFLSGGPVRPEDGSAYASRLK